MQNFPFIEQDFDALTDYELLCKVVEYLNKVIDGQNTNAEQIEELETAFNQLQSYVNNYFDNLDVQEEIDNKLEEMADDGTLQEIIAAYLNANAVWGFDNIASMKGATNLISGSYAKTSGYYANNDGGGAFYKIREITNSDVVNDITIIAITGGTLIAELIIENSLNVLQCGLHNDGLTDNATKLTTVLSLLPDDASLYFPDGEYLFNSTVTFTKNVNIKCDGTLISNDTRPLFLLQHLKNCTFEIEKIEEETTQTVDFNENSSNNSAIILQNCLYINVKIAHIEKFVVALMLIANSEHEGGCYYNTIEVKHIESCFHGIVLMGLAGGCINANTFNNIVYDYHTWDSEETPYFIQIRNVDGNNYYNNANNFYKLQAEYGVSVTGGCKLLNIKNGQSNYFEFDRVEIASTSNQQPFVFTPTYARCNQVLVKYMTTSMTYTLTSDVNVVTFPLQYGVTNRQNNVKNITSSLTLAEHVSIAQGSVFVDYLRQVCYVNIVLQTSAAIAANTSIVTGLPTPVDHILLYERVAASTNLYVKPSDDTILYITRSLNPSTIVNRLGLGASATVSVNLAYKISAW